VVSSACVKAGVVGEAITGYTVVMADDIDAAAKMAKGAPSMAYGLKVALHPMMDMMAPAKK
jgi:hypothetical protein